MILRRRERVFQDDLAAGEYMQLDRSKGYGDIFSAVWRCPLCMKVIGLGRRLHVVEYSGTVTPSVTCPTKMSDGSTCAFDETLALEDWLPETKGSA